MTVRSVTCTYKEGLRACDYAPIHGMLIKEYHAEDVLIQLSLFCPSRVREESFFAWAIYLVEDGNYVFKDLQSVIFDDNLEAVEQRLPDIGDLGISFYKKLTDRRIYV